MVARQLDLKKNSLHSEFTPVGHVITWVKFSLTFLMYAVITIFGSVGNKMSCSCGEMRNMYPYWHFESSLFLATRSVWMLGCTITYMKILSLYDNNMLVFPCLLTFSSNQSLYCFLISGWGKKAQYPWGQQGSFRTFVCQLWIYEIKSAASKVILYWTQTKLSYTEHKLVFFLAICLKWKYEIYWYCGRIIVWLRLSYCSNWPTCEWSF